MSSIHAEQFADSEISFSSDLFISFHFISFCECLCQPADSSVISQHQSVVVRQQFALPFTTLTVTLSTSSQDITNSFYSVVSANCIFDELKITKQQLSQFFLNDIQHMYLLITL